MGGEGTLGQTTADFRLEGLDVHGDHIVGIEAEGLALDGEVAEGPLGGHIGLEDAMQPGEKPSKGREDALGIPVRPQILQDAVPGQPQPPVEGEVLQQPDDSRPRPGRGGDRGAAAPHREVAHQPDLQRWGGRLSRRRRAARRADRA